MNVVTAPGYGSVVNGGFQALDAMITDALRQVVNPGLGRLLTPDYCRCSPADRFGTPACLSRVSKLGA
jgi:hypothetical protein